MINLVVFKKQNQLATETKLKHQIESTLTSIKLSVLSAIASSRLRAKEGRAGQPDGSKIG